MIATAVIFLALAAIALVVQARRIEKLTDERDQALVKGWQAEDQADFWEREATGYRRHFAQECGAHDVTASQRDAYREAASDHYKALCLVLDAHARDIVLDPLGSDLIADEPKIKAVRP